MDTPAIAARGLTKRFGKTLALAGLDLDVPAGAIVGLLGPAGAGKSTAIRLLSGLARPSAGSASIAGEPVRPGDGVAARRGLGVVPQDPGLPLWMTVRELLAFLAGLSGVTASDMTFRIGDVAQRLALESVLDRQIGDLPAAVQGRAAVAQALVAEPAVLLLDDPFQRLDPEARLELRALLRSLAGRTTILLATHRIADVEGLCDRVALLVAGRLVAEASTVDFLARFAPPVYVAEVDGRDHLALEGLVARLQAEPWVAEAVVIGSSLRVAVTDDDRAARELLPAVVATGLTIGTFRRGRPSLEAVVAGLDAGSRRATP
jgi:ABC-2 type transport system ATP-binding protein